MLISNGIFRIKIIAKMKSKRKDSNNYKHLGLCPLRNRNFGYFFQRKLFDKIMLALNTDFPLIAL